MPLLQLLNSAENEKCFRENAEWNDPLDKRSVFFLHWIDRSQLNYNWRKRCRCWTLYMAYLRNLISLKCLDLRRFQMISLGRQGITWPHLMTLVMVVKMGFTYINQAKSFFHVRSTIQSLGGACIIDNMATASMCWVCVTMFFKNSMYSSSMLLLMLLVLWIEFMRQRQFTIYYFGSSCPLHHCLLVVFFFFFNGV